MRLIGGKSLALLGGIVAVARVDAALLCYKAKDAATKATYTTDVSGLTDVPECQIKVPGDLFCIDSHVAATGGTPTFPDRSGGDGGPVLCYKMKCPKSTLSPLAWNDPVGTRQIQPSGPKLVCSGGASGSFTTFISRSWTMSAGEEGYVCHTMQADSDTFITGLRQIAPPGTYEMTLTVTGSTMFMGDYNCTAGTNTLGAMALYAAGLGTNDLVFPPGVAEHVKAGQFVTLNMHVSNAGGATPLSGTSGVQVQTGGPVDAAHEAAMTFAGTLNIAIPPDGIAHTAIGGCNTVADSHVFALWPHMRAVGVRAELVDFHAGVPDPLLDTAFALDPQPVHSLAPLPIAHGDDLQITCYYVNNTGQTVNFGDSTHDESCFVGVYHYPTNAFTSPGPDTTFSCVN